LRPLDPLPDDGLIPVVVWDRMPGGGLKARTVLYTPQEVSAWSAERMARHDERNPVQRWGGNQWGEGWVTRPAARGEFEERQPLLASDLSLKDWLRG
jgi:hypothetical protein